MNSKDLILKTMITNPKKDPNVFYTPKSLNSYILKDKNIDEIEFFVKEIIREKPELIKIRKVPTDSFAFSPTGLVKSFLENGGFEKIEIDLKEKNDLEFRKSKIDLELAEKMLEEYPKTKWFARIGAFIALILALKEIFEWIMTL